jgi:hypothetical protein
VAGQGTAENGKDIVFDLDYFFAFGDGDLAAAGYDALERCDADEGITAQLLAVFNRLQHEALALRPGRAQKGRDRGFEVGRQDAADRDEGMFFGEGQKLFTAGLDGLAGCFHFRLV